MKTFHYLAGLPQEASIKEVDTFRDYDLITLDLPVSKQRLCPHCGSHDCVIKDAGVWQTVRHIPYNHRGSVLSFHKRRLLCKDCRTSFYETPYWIPPSLRMTQALYDSILLDILEPISFSQVARRNCVSTENVQAVFETIRFDLPKKLPPHHLYRSFPCSQTPQRDGGRCPDPFSASISECRRYGKL